MFEYLLIVAFVLSIALNAHLIWERKHKAPIQEPEHLKILYDLLNKNKVLVRIERIDPSSFFLRSPKE